jgi:hypothetical protein
VLPAGEAVARARSAGIAARLLPGISAIDCLFADLGVDPAAAGCQIYEAGDVLRRELVLEPRAGLVLLQAGVVGEETHSPEGSAPALPALVAALQQWYPAQHELVIYEASPYPGVPPLVERVRLGELAGAALSQRSTVYVPPLPR